MEAGKNVAEKRYAQVDLFGDEIVNYAQPPTSWFGGKRQIAHKLIPLIDKIEHETYVEPFFGMGGLFFRRPEKAKREIINDRNGEIVNLFRCLQSQHKALLEAIRWNVWSREKYEDELSADTSGLSEIERAARLLYIIHNSFSGKVDGGFRITAHHLGACSWDPKRWTDRLSRIHERLEGVLIENHDWSKIIDKYDSESTLFYLDPPYQGFASAYGKGIFSEDDHVQIGAKLHGIDGQFVLSINDSETMRAMYDGCKIHDIPHSYSTNTAHDKQRMVNELAIVG